MAKNDRIKRAVKHDQLRRALIDEKSRKIKSIVDVSTLSEEEIRRLQAEHWTRPAKQYHLAGTYHGNPAHIEQGDLARVTGSADATLDAINKALSPGQGRELDGAADRELLERTIFKTPYMGPMQLKTRAGKRGPAPRGNQYFYALKRRSDLYRRIVKLPALGRDSGYLRDPTYLELVIRVLSDPALKPRERRARLSDEIRDARRRLPDTRTLTRMLKAVETYLKRKLSEMPVP